MNRLELVEILKIAQPALAVKDFIPMFTKFCFTGETVRAYNDIIGMEVLCESGVSGCVQGSTLLGLLENSRAKEVELKTTKESMKIKASQANFKLPLTPEDEFIFELPDLEKDSYEFSVGMDFIKGLKLCLMSASEDTSRPTIVGISMLIEEGRATLYSTDGLTMSRSIVEVEAEGPDKEFSRVSLGNDFCRNLVWIAEKYLDTDEQISLIIGKGYIVADIGDMVLLFSRLVLIDETPFNYEKAIKDNIASIKAKDYMELPKSFPLAIKRAMVVQTSDDNQTVVTINNGKMQFVTSTPHGEVKDLMKLKKEHTNIKAIINTKKVAKIMDICNNVYILDNCTAFKEGNFTHLIANMRKQDEEV